MVRAVSLYAEWFCAGLCPFAYVFFRKGDGPCRVAVFAVSEFFAHVLFRGAFVFPYIKFFQWKFLKEISMYSLRSLA